MCDDNEMEYALWYVNQISRWTEVTGGAYSLMHDGEALCTLDSETYFWRKLEGSLNDINEKELSPEGRMMINLFLNVYGSRYEY